MTTTSTEAPQHVPSDPHCVRNVGGLKAGLCRICAKYDNAVWLTQREMFEERG